MRINWFRLTILNLFYKQKEFIRKDVEEVMGIGTTNAINMIKEMIAKNLIEKVKDKIYKEISSKVES